MLIITLRIRNDIILPMNKERLDLFLVKNNYCESRNKAQELIAQQKVLVNGEVATKSNMDVNSNDVIEIIEPLPFVSRAGLKMLKAIETWNLDLKDKVVLDVGASTGGFSDCCLQHGAKKVYCLDVGTDQLHESLKNNPKVVDLSPINIKELNQSLIAEPIDYVVSDLSFISSKFMFAALNTITLDKDVKVISLIKPQFELSPEIVGKNNGVIKEPKYHQEAILKVIQYATDNNFKNLGIIESPIKGAKKNNTEFLGLFVYGKK